MSTVSTIRILAHFVAAALVTFALFSPLEFAHAVGTLVV